MAEQRFTEQFGNIQKIKVCTTATDLNFNDYTDAGAYEIFEDLGNEQSRIYSLTVDTSSDGACTTQTRIYSGKVEYRRLNNGQWTAWIGIQGGGGTSSDNPTFTGTINFDGAKLYYDAEGEGAIVLYRPVSAEYATPDSTLKIGYDTVHLNKFELYHSGNLKDITVTGNVLDDVEKAFFMKNTGLDVVLGDIETALDSIISMQSELIGGDTE